MYEGWRSRQAAQPCVGAAQARKVDFIPCRVREHTIAVLGLGKTVDGDFLTSDDVEESKTVTSSAKSFDYLIDGTQVLVDRATAIGDSVFYFATGRRQQGPIVILNSVFRGNGNLEPHQRWSTGLLVDNCSVPDGGSPDSRRRSRSGHDRTARTRGPRGRSARRERGARSR